MLKHRAYQNEKWLQFSELVKARDNYKCLKCGRTKNEVTLQVHHTYYKKGVEVWEYALSDCITLCKGCHAKEHNIIEPTSGWALIAVNDLGGTYGMCEKEGCNSEIRYEFTIYRPSYGYKVVGSTCVEYLTREDQNLGAEVIKLFQRISDFLRGANWRMNTTKYGKNYLSTTHMHHEIRIYGNEKPYTYQIALKEKGNHWFEFGKFLKAGQNTTLDQVKELAFIVLKGTITKNAREKELLRNLYKKISS